MRYCNKGVLNASTCAFAALIRALRSVWTTATVTIEPMITVGPADMWMWDDDWTALTVTGQRTAQFEHTMVVTDAGVDLLTLPSDGEPAEERFAVTEVDATA